MMVVAAGVVGETQKALSEFGGTWGVITFGEYRKINVLFIF